MKTMFLEILMNHFPDSQIKEADQYTALQVKNKKDILQHYIELHFSEKNTRITIRKNNLSLEDMMEFEIVPESYGWVINAKKYIQNTDELMRIMPQIKKSYLNVKNNEEELVISDIDDLKIGKRIDNKLLSKLFSVAPQGGMRKSNERNHLVLITDRTKDIYKDRWDGNLLYYSGMGKIGDQNINFAQNKTLANSNETNIPIFLFEVLKKKEYTYRGKVELFTEPFTEEHLDINNQKRKVLIFPLIVNNNILENHDASKVINKSNNNKKKENSEIEEKNKKLKGNKVSSRVSTTTIYERDQDIVEYAKRRANGICELCKKALDFLEGEGRPFLETHHIEWLSKGGEDTIENTVALCPNCHKKMHVLDKESDREYLLQKKKFI
ncbi:MAG: HNH endonuclease [Vagococcus salmoninarum]|uniref:HNH endonuclease n=1 Tax=Vagococcus salmoninarum TaxID=2739 RepID=UPI003F9EB17F